MISVENQPQKPTQPLTIMGKLVLCRYKDWQAVLSSYFEGKKINPKLSLKTIFQQCYPKICHSV